MYSGKLSLVTFRQTFATRPAGTSSFAGYKPFSVPPPKTISQVTPLSRPGLSQRRQKLRDAAGARQAERAPWGVKVCL